MHKKFTKNRVNNAILISLVIGLIVISFLVREVFYDYALEANLEKARQLRKELVATRHYIAQISPKIKVIDENLSPFSVTPAYVGAHILREISKKEGIYAKQTALDYRNPKNAPDDFEKEILHKYKAGEIEGEYFKKHILNGKENLRYTYPLYIEKECMACHGKPYVDVKAKTYKLLKAEYGDVAFNYKVGDLRGMLSIAIETEAIEKTVEKLDTKIVTLFIIFFIIIGVLLFLEKQFIYKPQLDKIKKMNETLAHRVREEIEKNRKKEHILIEQSKLAQMGEMINMIAHQWRQPLNVISSVAIRLKLKLQLGKLEEKEILEVSNLITSKVQEMSGIINDFMEFNKPGTRAEFSLLEAVNKVVEMVQAQFESRGIALEIDIDKSLVVYHNEKAIEHVLLNLMTNSRDAFEDHKEIKDRKVKIFTQQKDDIIKLGVWDNAGGIPEDIITKIFNPYFTTKEQGKGTGIGLYMSKKMVEQEGNAQLDVEVKGSTTIFYITFKG